MSCAVGGRSGTVGSAVLRARRVGLVVLVLLSALLLGPAAAAARAADPRSWPLAGPPQVSRSFAPPEVRYAPGHRGVDVPSTVGAPVLAAAAGRVTYAGLLAGRGVVVVSHGELRTTYEPVTAAVPVGAAVQAGSVLGQLEPGHLGCPVLACLHFGLRRGADYLDPVRWVTGGPVRLLPADGSSAGAPAGAGPGPAGAAAEGGPVPATVPRGRPAGGGRTAGPGAEGTGPDSAGSRPPARAQAEPAPQARTEGGPSWSLRSAEAPLGAAAVAALVAGIGLLARPRPPSPEPVSGGAAVPVPLPVDEPVAPPGELVDLDAARSRRRSG